MNAIVPRQRRAQPDRDASAFADQDIIAEIASRPNDMAIMLDQMLVERGGLKTFIELAWPAIEGDEYKSNWHIDAICEHLEAVSRGEIRRLAIACPPRHMKTLSVSVMWPAWDWLLHPERRFLFSSYAYNLVVDSSTKCRRVITSDWYRERWGDRYALAKDQNRKDAFINNRGGALVSASVTGQLTGKGSNIFVVDDPINVQDGESEAVRNKMLKWWRESTSSRLNDPKTGAFVIIQQRVHESDLVGEVLRMKSALPYTYLCLPAEYEPDHPHIWVRDPRKELGQLLWPDRIGRSEIEEFKAVQGPYAFSGQYQQRPAPREGGIFKRKWFTLEKEAPKDCDWSRAWDFAATAAKMVKSDPDWTATAKVGFSPSTGKWYVQEVLRWRVEPNQVRNLVINLATMDGKGSRQSIPKDPGQAGVDQSADYVRLLAGFNVIAEPQSGDKMTRAMPFAAQAAGGNIRLIEGDWNEDFLTEITSFPTGAHDDQVDATASAFNRLTDGMAGLLDFYRQKTAAMAQAQSAAATEQSQQPGFRIEHNSSTDYAKALFGKRD